MKKTMMSLGLLALSAVASAQTQVKPGFNLFSVQQDVEIGKQSANQAERQLPCSSACSTIASASGRRRAPLAGTIRCSAPRPSVPKTNGPIKSSPDSAGATSVAVAPSPKSVAFWRSRGLMSFV